MSARKTATKGSKGSFSPQQAHVSGRSARSSSAFVAVSALTGVAAPILPHPMPDPKDGPPCHLCTARCCKYFALEIDAPITPEDHDFIRWYLMHGHVVVWRQAGDWYLEVRTPCKHLLPDSRCAIYDARPQICREYGLPDADNPEGPCEFFTDDVDYDLFFDSPEAFEAWSRVELDKRARRLARRRESRRRKTGAGRAAEVA